MHTTFSTIAQLHAAARQLLQKQPLLRDRAWLHSNLDEKLSELAEELASGQWHPEGIQYHYVVYEKTLRSAEADCRSRVAMHAIFEWIAPLLGQGAIPHCAFQVEHSEALVERCRALKRENEWVAGADVRRFFDSVRHDTLLAALARYITCDVTLQLFRNLLAAFERASLVFAETEPSHRHEPGQGLPTGLQLPYLMANTLLMQVDKKMSALTAGRYARYLDDFVFFAPSQEALRDNVQVLETELARLGLGLNPEKSFLQSTSEPFRFLRHDI